MTEYHSIKACDNCKSLNLNYTVLKCKRTLCDLCYKTVECPCQECQKNIIFISKSCPDCKNPKIDGEKCKVCNNNISLSKFTIYNILYELARRVSCGLI